MSEQTIEKITRFLESKKNMVYQGRDRSETFQKKLILHSAFGAKVLRIASVLCATLLLSSCLTSSVRAERKNIIYSEDFERGIGKEWHREGCCNYSNAIVSSPVRSGNSSYRSQLKPKSNKAIRAEIGLDPFPKNAERWVGVSIFVPQEAHKGHTSLFQFHIKPDKGRPWTSPPFQMTMNSSNRLQMKRYGNATNGSSQSWDLGPVNRGQWMDFVFHLKSSHTSKGLLEVWINGQLKLKYNGVTSLDYSHGPHVKMGVYAAKGESTVYYDSFRIGNEKATYQDVAPGGN